MNAAVFQRITGPLKALAARLGDALNPIAVKELRQAVNAKYISGLLMFLLLGQTVAMAAFVLSTRRQEYSFDAGREAFPVFFGILAAVAVGLLPSYVVARGIYDRFSNNEELSRITALRPRSFIWGRLVSGLALTALIYSACAPFLVFTYLLRGIDLGSILLMLLIGLIASAFVIQLAVFLSSLPLPRLLMPLMGFIALGAGLYAAAWTVLFAVAYVEDDFAPNPAELAVIVTAILVLGLLATAFLFALSVAITSPRSANRALPVRLLMTIGWAPTLAIVLWGRAAVVYDLSFRLWFIITLVLYALALAFVVSERDVQGPRVLRHVPRRKWMRPVAFLFYSGSAGGILWWTIMVALTLIAAGMLWGSIKRHSYGHYGYWYPGWWTLGLFTPLSWGAVYLYAYAMTAVLIRRWFLPKLRPFLTWVMAIGVGAVAFVLPSLAYLLAVSSGFPPDDWLEWQVTTPLVLISWDESFRALGHWFVSAWALSVALMNAPWIVERYRAFRRVEPDVRTSQ